LDKTGKDDLNGPGIPLAAKIYLIITGALTFFAALLICASLVLSYRIISSLNSQIASGIVPWRTPVWTATPYLTATALPNPQLYPGNNIFTSTFSSEGPWDVGHMDDSYLTMDRRVDQGKYIWSVTAKIGFISTMVPSTNINIPFDNYQFSVDARMAAGPPDGTYGMVFDYTDNDNYWVWSIHADGTSYVEHLVGGSWANNSVRMIFPINAGEMNTITMKVSADTLYFYVDGAQVGSYKTTIPEIENFTSSKKFGICVELYDAGDKATFEFDNIVVSHPDIEVK